MSFLSLSAALCTILATGWLVLGLIPRRHTGTLPLEPLGLSFGAGSFVLSFALFLLAYFRIPLSPLTVFLLVVGLLGVLASIKRVWRGFSFSPARLQNLKRWIETLGDLSWFEWTCVATVAVFAALIALDSVSQPLLGFDSRAIWGMKAKVLFQEKGIYGEDFFDASRLHAHQRYPLLLPLLESFVCSFLGGISERLMKLLFPAFYVSLILVFYATMRHRFSRSYALLGATVLAGLPVFSAFSNGGAASGYADLPLAYFVFVHAVSLHRFLESKQVTDLAISLLFGLAAVFTKNEGLALCGIALVCFGGVRLMTSRWTLKEWLPLLLATALAAIILFPWFQYRSQLPLIDENYWTLLKPSHLLAGLDRVPFILKAFLKEYLLKVHLWNVLGVMLVAALVLSPVKSLKGPHIYFLALPLLYSALLLGIFMTTDWRVEEQIPVALSRLVMQTIPLLMLWLFHQFHEANLTPPGWTKTPSS
ncbi:MAG: hypothetical protein AB1898_12865 [Acidobacteriota bacterium]